MASNAVVGDSVMEFEDVMIMIGFGKVHWLVLVTTGLLLMFVVCETMGMAIVSTGSQCDFNTEEIHKSLIQAAAFLGIICSAYIWGYYTDVLGRHYVLVRSTSLAIACSLCSTLMTNYWMFVLLRFMTGVFLAGTSFAALLYLGEFCTRKNRAVVINYMATFNGFGMIYAPGMGELLMDYDWYIPIYGDLEFRPWRLLGLFLTVPGIISLLLLLQLPESPRFSLAAGAKEKALQTTSWLCYVNTGKDLRKDFNVVDMKPLAQRAPTGDTSIVVIMLREWKELFHAPYLKRFLISCTIMFGLFLIANGMGIWFTDMRNRVNLVAAFEENAETNTTTVCNTMNSYAYEDVEVDQFICNDGFIGFVDSILLGLTFISMYIILGLLLMVWPRKPIFVTVLCLSGCCGMGLTYVTNQYIIRILFLIFLATPGVIINLLGGAILEFVPTYLRGKGSCICQMFGRMGAVSGMAIMGSFLESHCVGAFIFFATFPFICALLGYFLPLDAHYY